MGKIYLTKSEKIVFKTINGFNFDKDNLVGLSQAQIIHCAQSLKDKGLISGLIFDDELINIRETNLGTSYKIENPRLRNPISATSQWIIGIVVTLLTAIIIKMIA